MGVCWMAMERAVTHCIERGLNNNLYSRLIILKSFYSNLINAYSLVTALNIEILEAYLNSYFLLSLKLIINEKILLVNQYRVIQDGML